MTSRKLQNLNFLDLQNFPRATCMRNKWPQSNKLFKLRNETLRTNITHGFPFLGSKKQSLHFSLCGQLLFIIRCKTKVYLPQSLWFTGTHPTFFKRSSNFPTVLTLNDKCSTWFCFVTRVLWLMFKPWCTPWFERTREIWFLLYKIDRSKVAQDFSARSKHGAHHGPIKSCSC